jgi:3-phosphoshikimate 1-carboxyvinyltransferase
VELWVRPGRALRGEVGVPGDKSIAHRALIAAALGEGVSTIRGFDPLDDCLRTLEALRACGVEGQWTGPRELAVMGRGLRGLLAPAAPLQCGLSGTTMRLLAGVLAGQPLVATLDGDPPLRRRPMARVTGPLAQMGARIEGPGGGHHAPLIVHGGGLRGIDYTLPVASAQVKSAILLAAVNAEGETVVREPAPSRDHTERILRRLGVPLEVSDGVIRLRNARPWPGDAFVLPGDLSAAAFLLVAATLVPGSEVCIRQVGLNPTRTAILDVLQAMGAHLTPCHHPPPLPLSETGARGEGPPLPFEEPAGDLVARHSTLRGVEIGGRLIPNLIDELPILAVAATQAEGRTVVRDAAELRVKETDRIAALASELRAMGACFEPAADGFLIEGPTPLRGARVDAHGDHRMAMALAVAGLVAEGETVIAGAENVAKSFPGFFDVLGELGAEVKCSA